MVHIRQKFKTTRIDNVSQAVAEQFKRPEVRAKVKPGMTIAVGVGSRGIANIAECAKQVVAELKALGAKPFIFPAMGSHGGATAEGQRQVLEDYGITESYVGCPIQSQHGSGGAGQGRRHAGLHGQARGRRRRRRLRLPRSSRTPTSARRSRAASSR